MARLTRPSKGRSATVLRGRSSGTVLLGRSSTVLLGRSCGTVLRGRSSTVLLGRSCGTVLRGRSSTVLLGRSSGTVLRGRSSTVLLGRSCGTVLRGRSSTVLLGRSSGTVLRGRSSTVLLGRSCGTVLRGRSSTVLLGRSSGTVLRGRSSTVLLDRSSGTVLRGRSSTVLLGRSCGTVLRGRSSTTAAVFAVRLDQRDFDSRLLQDAEVGLGRAAVGDDFLQGRGWGDQRQAAAAKFAGVADGDGFLRDLDHDLIDLGFEQVRRAEPEVNVAAVHAQKQDVGAKSAQGFLRDWSDQGKRILAQRAAGENDFDGGAGEFSRDVYGVGDDGDVLEIAQSAGDGGGRRAGIENQDLSFFYFLRRAIGNAQLFLMVKLFFFAQRGVFECAFT